MKTTYKGYTIVHGDDEAPNGWLALTLRIVAPDGGPVVSGINSGTEMMFATEALADQAGVLLARYWIDGRERTFGQ